MSLDDWDALPEDNSACYELQEGVLVVSPRPARRHSNALLALGMQIRQQCPPGWQTLLEFEVVMADTSLPTVRVPDIVVTRAGGPEARVFADKVLLAVEIISPGSRKVDLHFKTFEYAEAGIPYYWVVDLDPPAPSVMVFGLGAPGDGYAESQRNVTGELVVSEPFPLRIDVAALADPS